MFVVFIHELGHFIVAKLSGVKVYEFGIGIPPRAFTLFTDSSGTRYTINVIPLWWFVRLKWEDFNDDPYDHEALVYKPLWKKMSVILAGVFMNFMLAGIIFSLAFWVGVGPLAINSKVKTDIDTLLIPTIEQAIEKKMINVDGLELSPLVWSEASRGGLSDKDRLVSVDGKVFNKPEEMVEYVSKSTAPMRFKVKRDDMVLEKVVTAKDGKIGSYIGYHVVSTNEEFVFQYPFLEAVKVGFTEMYNQSRLTLSFLKNLVVKIVSPKNATERKEAVGSLSGPVGVGSMFVGLVDAQVKISVIFLIMAVISINLWVFNLLPFPALDGGRFFFMTIGSFLSLFMKKNTHIGYIESVAHVVGFFILIGLSIFVAYQDILRLFQ